MRMPRRARRSASRATTNGKPACARTCGSARRVRASEFGIRKLEFGIRDRPHRRFNPLRGEWVIVSPQREERPWRGQIEPPPPSRTAPYDPDCYLCPGNMRAGGAANPRYTSTFVFDNDFPALSRPDERAGPAADERDDGLLLTRPAAGLCRVVCF